MSNADLPVGNASPAEDGVKLSTIKQRRDFLAARAGARFHGRAFVIQAVRRSDDACNDLRFGLTVTKRIGNAVVRNRIKRRLRSAFEHSMPHIPHQCSGMDVVVIARIEALTLPFDDLVADLAKGLPQLVAKLQANGQ